MFGFGAESASLRCTPSTVMGSTPAANINCRTTLEGKLENKIGGAQIIGPFVPRVPCGRSDEKEVISAMNFNYLIVKANYQMAFTSGNSSSLSTKSLLCRLRC
jgi:hypothetical protein